MKKIIKSTFLILCLFIPLTGLAAEATEPAADNSGRNVRDSLVTEMTADDQPNNIQDIELTRKIRAELGSKKDFSTYAKNIKIIVIGKQIILKGPVRTASEKGTIAKVAHKIAPDHKVQNELEVVTQ